MVRTGEWLLGWVKTRTALGRPTDGRCKNDHVWDVLQPALQLVTRFLKTDHPYFVALLDAKSRRIIDASRLLFGKESTVNTNWISFTADFDPTKGSTWENPEQLGAACIAEIDDYDFDLAAAAANFLKDRLSFQIFSSNSTWQKGQLMDEIIWGLTETFGQRDPMGAGITISIGAEMVWPLLIPEFTPAEKASCTMMIVATMLHEFAVSISIFLLECRHRYSVADLSLACGPVGPVHHSRLSPCQLSWPFLAPIWRAR
jgi:hypothetical protein